MSLLSKENAPVLVTSDFCENFMKLTRERFDQSDFGRIEGHQVHIDDETDYVTNGQRFELDDIVQEQGNFSKLVLGCRASGSALPYPDAWFTSYIANLVLMIVDDSHAMIKESYRVL